MASTAANLYYKADKRTAFFIFCCQAVANHKGNINKNTLYLKNDF